MYDLDNMSNFIIRELDKFSMLRRCLIFDTLPPNTVPHYDNETNQIAVCMKSFHKTDLYEIERQKGSVVKVPLFKIASSIPKKILNSWSFNDSVEFISTRLLEIEDGILESLLLESIKLSHNIIDKNEDDFVKKIKLDLSLKGFEGEHYYSSLLTPPFKKNIEFVCKYFCKLGINVYKVKRFKGKSVYVLGEPEYVGVMPIKKDVSFIDDGDDIIFYSEIGAAIVYTECIQKIKI